MLSPFGIIDISSSLTSPFGISNNVLSTIHFLDKADCSTNFI